MKSAMKSAKPASPLRAATEPVPEPAPDTKCLIDAAPADLASVPPVLPVTSASLGEIHVRSLLCGGEISADDAVVALGLRAPARDDTTSACRERVSAVWNDLAEQRRICSIVWEIESTVGLGGVAPPRPWGRCVVVEHGADGAATREIHGSRWYQDRVYAGSEATRWAKRNRLVAIIDRPFS